MRLFIILTLLSACTTALSQKQAAYDPYAAATFDLLNNKPFFQLQSEDTAGHIFNTTSLAGKTIYVDFWFTACRPCIQEVPYSKSLQQFFTSDTNVVFLNICIDNIERKQAWKQIIQGNKMHGIQLFYARNRPQKINLLREYKITFPTYLLVNKEMKVIGYNAPRPSEEGWVHWAIFQAEQNNLLSASYKKRAEHSKEYNEFINENWKKIISLKP